MCNKCEMTDHYYEEVRGQRVLVSVWATEKQIKTDSLRREREARFEKVGYQLPGFKHSILEKDVS